jgi:hypothetical protein
MAESLLPPPFRGSTKEDALAWWTHFERYLKFKSLTTVDDIRALFAVLLRDGASDWYESLTAAPTTIQELKDKFADRYAASELRKWSRASDIWSINQQAGESSDDYIMKVQKEAKQVGMTEDAMIRYAIIKGLRPAIRAHVLQVNPDTTDKLIIAARVGELSDVSTTDPVVHQLMDELRANQMEVKRLAAKLDTVSIQSIDNKEDTKEQRAVSPRHVSFSNEHDRRSFSPRPGREDNQRERSPGPPRYQSGDRSRDRGQRWDDRRSTSPWAGRKWNSRTKWQAPSRAAGNTYQRSPMNRDDQRPAAREPPGQQPSTTGCYRCGKQHQFSERCPAIGGVCYACGKANHFSSVCRSAVRAQVPRP